MIFYFTATGNSLYAAKYLEEERISIPQIIDKEHLEFQADRIGIVCPVYGHEVPQMVQDFLAKASFETDYFYMVLTYGNRHGGAAELAWKLCRKCGIQPDYINVLMMVDNWLPSFDMNEQRAIDKKVDDHLEVIKKEIEGRVHKISEVTDTDRAAHQQFLENQSKLPADLWQHLITVGEGCVGCGLCEQVCPSGSIRVEQGKAEVNEGYTPKLKPLGVSLDAYGTIILGTPTWWYTMAPAVLSFLRENDLSGKRVIPFQTHVGWPGHGLKDIEEELPGAVVEKGKMIQFSAQEFGKLVTPKKEIQRWIAEL